MLYYNPDPLVRNKRHGELGEKTKSIFNSYGNPKEIIKKMDFENCKMQLKKKLCSHKTLL